MPKLHYRLTVDLGRWKKSEDPAFGNFSVMVTARPGAPGVLGEAVLRFMRESVTLLVEWDTLVAWGCAETCEREDPALSYPDRTVFGNLVEIGDSEEHKATPETEHAVAIVRMSVDEARRAAAFIGHGVWITRMS